MTAPWMGWQNEYDRFDRAIDRLRAALQDAAVRFKESGGGSHTHLQVSCPLHEDREPSLSIDDRGTGRLVMFCHAGGCEEADLLEALGLRNDQLWDEQARPCPQCGRRSLEPGPRSDYTHDGCADPTNTGRATRRRGGTTTAQAESTPPRLGPLPKRLVPADAERDYRVVVRRRVTDRYEHITVDGEVVAVSVRSEEIRQYEEDTAPRTVKAFWQEYTDGAGAWLRTKPAGLSVPIWRLPEIQAAIRSGIRIWLTEGHKDAKSLLAAQVEATTNIAGALGFNEEDAEQLRGGHLVVVCDRDHAGYSRGLKVLRLLDGVAASVQVVLPLPYAEKSDATDHFQAGFGLDDFVPVTADELHAMQLAAAIAGQIGAPDIAMIGHEAAAQLALAAEAEDKAPKRAEEHRRKAARWAAEAGRGLLRLAGRMQDLSNLTAHTDSQLSAAADQVDDFARQVEQIYAECGIAPPADVLAILNAPDDDNTVIDPQPPQWSRIPQHPISMMRGEWRYDTGSNCDRGVYLWTPATDGRPGQWRWLAAMPYVQARIVRRDGGGVRCGTDYLLSAHEIDPAQVQAKTASDADGKPVTITYLGLRDGTWANELGINLSQDDKIIKAVATAILDLAQRAPERETTPRIDRTTGKINIPVPDSLPSGYLRCAPGGREQGLAVWAEIIRVVADAPKMALVTGASAVSPFLSSLKHHHQSHFVALYGDPRQGKTATLRLAGAVWGDSRPSDEGGVVTGWNASGIGTARYAGMLGSLPPIFDESGMKKNTPGEWAETIYSLCEGARRLTAETRGPGIRLTKPWHGVLITAGNGRLTAGLGAGADAGIAARVIDLATPISTSAAQAELLEDELLSLAYGHAGLAILDQVSLSEVEALVADAAEEIGMPETGAGRTIAKALHTHVAGAALLDRVAGTGCLLRDAAVVAATEHLAEWAEPEHDADRMLSAIQDARAREPAMWPTVSVFLQHLEPEQDFSEPTGSSRLPRHGVNRTMSGVTADDGSWLAVFKKPWKELCDTDGVDQTVALRELHKRGLLSVTPKQRRRGEWTARIRATGVDMYKLLLPPDWDDDTDQMADPEPSPADPELSGQRALGTDPITLGQTHGDRPAESDPNLAKKDSAASGENEVNAIWAAAAAALNSGADTHVREPGQSLEDHDLAVPTPSVRGSEEDVRGETDGCTGSVRGDVRGDKVALTRGVRGVRGERGEDIRVPAREPSHGLDPTAIQLDPDAEPGVFRSSIGTEHSRTRALNDGPCEHCARPTVQVLDGNRLHPRCLEDRLREADGSTADSTAESTADPAVEPRRFTAEGTADWTDEQFEAAVGECVNDPAALGLLELLIDAREAAARAHQGSALTSASPAASPSQPPQTRIDSGTPNGQEARPAAAGGQASTKNSPRISVQGVPGGRFAAPAAVLDAEYLHLPGRPPQPWHARHLGELALLTAPDRLRLGWGGGEDRFPDEGQLWLDAGALQRLGLPITVDVPEGLAASDRARRAAVSRAFAPVLKAPAVADAMAAGWRIGQHGLDAWTRIWHPELLPRGAWLVAIPWERVSDVPLLEDLSSSRLVERLAEWAAAVGVSYRLSPASTGMDLIDHTRPPRRSHDDDLGAGRQRRALVRGEAAELPDFLSRPRDDRFRSVEADFSFWRPWTALLPSERAKPFVALYDRHNSYLAPWSNVELGLEGLIHRDGSAARWDGSEKPGYFLVDRWAWDAWWLPDPAQTGAVSAFVARDRVWITSHTLRQLKLQGIEPRVHESYTWQVSSRYLEPASKRIRDALTSDVDPSVRGTIKALYSSTVGKFGEHDHRPDYHLWRPDWRHHIIANSRTAILSTLRKIHELSGAAPLVVDRDMIAFAVDNPDPWQAWPGSADKLGDGVGKWAPIGVAPLAEWGPAFLTTQTRAGQRWRYADAVDATSLPDRR